MFPGSVSRRRMLARKPYEYIHREIGGGTGTNSMDE